MNTECASQGHDWVPIGVYLKGNFYVPCRRNGCKMELKQVWQVIEGAGTSINGIELDIEDHPQGGVAKVICREAAGKYDNLPLEPGDVVIDIGAHVGIISIYLAKRYPGIKVYAFEPVEANFLRLLRNIAANQAKGITAVNKAVLHETGRVLLYTNLTANSGGGSTLFSMGTIVSGGNAENTESTTLADIFAEYGIERCKLLKIDCEGSEHAILSSSEALLDRVDYLRGEFHINGTLEAQGWSIEELLQLCRRHIKAENIVVTGTRMGN